MATKKSTLTKDKIVSMFMQDTLENNEKPKSVYHFAKANGLTETEFYTFFGGLEGVEKEIENEVRNQLGEHSETSEYERVLSEIEGRTGENQQSTIFVDVTKFYKITDFYFRKTDVKGLFMSTKVTKVEDKIMVIIVDGQEYDCLFDETIFEELKEFLNN